jgi:hypothetical protein
MFTSKVMAWPVAAKPEPGRVTVPNASLISGEQNRMLCSEDHRPAVHVRIAASEAGDFNKPAVRVSDKQHYSFGQKVPKGRACIPIGQLEEL